MKSRKGGVHNVPKEQRRVFELLEQVLAVGAAAAGGLANWHYQLIRPGLVESVMKDPHHELRVKLRLDRIVAVKQVAEGLLLIFDGPFVVQDSNGAEGTDTSWPLYLDWDDHRVVRDSLLKAFG